MSPATVHLSRPRASDIAGEYDGHLHIVDRVAYRDQMRALRDQMVQALRGQPALSSAAIGRQIDASACMVGRVANLFPRYFMVDKRDAKTQGMLIALHPHLAAHA